MSYLYDLKFTKDSIPPTELTPTEYISVHKLPWLEIYASVGEELINWDDKTSSLVTVLSVPHKYLTAAIVSAGALLKLASRYSRQGSTVEEHFQYLSSLKDGTKLTWNNGTSQLIGEKKASDEMYLEILTRAGGKTEKTAKENPAESSLLSPALCTQFNVHEAENQNIKLPVKSYLDKPLTGPSNLAKTILGDNDNANFFTFSSNSCVIVGELASLNKEIRETPVFDSLNNKSYLEDIVRLRTTNPNNISKTQIWPSRSPADKRYNENPPDIVIFDGSKAFIKWRFLFGGSPWCVILDRTEHDFELAVKDVEQDYSLNRIPGKPINTVLTDYPAIEILQYART